ncbi:MAG: GNAT family N-acetyltransferase [Pseudomonadales bacterium]|nr:GNAT family N-acetyltransferase [Pseudomonadales bacterium]
MVKFRVENRTFLKQWEPKRPPEFFTEGFWQMQSRANLREFREGASVCLVLTLPASGEVAGVCNYTNIVRGTFLACHLGYALAERHQGTGLMFEALQAGNRFIFEELGLNRIMANYLPRNARSGQLLERLGFEVEGRARRFLKINGVWEDHVLTSLVNPATRDDP